MRNESLHALFFALAAILLLVVVSAYRLPRIYTPLWEDEIHHHYPILSSPSFVQMRRDIVYQNKAVLDYALRRFLFHTVVTPTERELHLVSLVIAALHLSLILFYPWTESCWPRLIAALFLASNGLENGYSTEAQYYALSSLMGTVPFLALHWALKKSWSGNVVSGAVGLLLALFLAANTNYFIAPLVLVVFAFYAIGLRNEVTSAAWKPLASIWVAGGAVLGRWAFWLNKYSWRQLRTAPMVPAHHPTFSILKNIRVLELNYSLMGMPEGLFYGLTASSLANRNRVERYMAMAVAGTLLIVKPLFFAYYSYKSDLGLFDRYTIMYVGPAALTVGLGLSSVMGWIEVWIRPMVLRGLTLAALCLYPIYSIRDNLGAWTVSVLTAMSLWRIMPANYSKDFHFFEHVDSLKGPLLVLVDHPWCSDIPKMYMEGGIVGPRMSNEVLTLDVATMPYGYWSVQASEFIKQHKTTGSHVVYYFERGRLSHSGACDGHTTPQFAWPVEAGCMAIFSAKELPAAPPLGKIP